MRVEDVKNITVAGSGIMGPGIAQVCAEAGYRVYLVDIEDEILRTAFNKIAVNLEKLVREGSIDRAKVNSILSRIVLTIDIKRAISDVDLLFEAIPERMDLKKAFLREVDRLCPNRTIMASNTSSLSITNLGLNMKKPDRFIGAHWMLPPHICTIVEIVRGEKTSDETIDFMKAFLKRLGKVVIISKDSPGFIVNRMQAAMLREAISLVEQGICSTEDVDLVWTRHLGLRYCLEGPFQFLDRSGLDTWNSVFQCLHGELKENRFQPPDSLKNKVNAGDLGMKTGKGFYDYSSGSIETITEKRDEKLLSLLKIMKKQ